MKWLKRIWRWLFGKKDRYAEKLQAHRDHIDLKVATEKWVEPIKVVEPIPEPVKRVYDVTPNPNKYWKRFKRGKKYYWKKYYTSCQ